jgi:hypothetical protein
MSLCCDWARELAAAATGADPDTMAAICAAEHGGNFDPDPAEPGDNGQSRGLGQIYLPAHPQFAGLNLDDPHVNAQAAAQVFTSQGYPAWSTYNSGLYRQYLGHCGGAAAAGASLASLPLPSRTLAGLPSWAAAALPAGLLLLIFALAFDELS